MTRRVIRFGTGSGAHRAKYRNIKTTAALRIKAPSIYGWEKIPPLRQVQLEKITGGKLKADTRIFIRCKWVLEKPRKRRSP